jgi:hypothetical protein
VLLDGISGAKADDRSMPLSADTAVLLLLLCRFKAYVQQAQKERDRRSAAQVLKKLVQV